MGEGPTGGLGECRTVAEDMQLVFVVGLMHVLLLERLRQWCSRDPRNNQIPTTEILDFRFIFKRVKAIVLGSFQEYIRRNSWLVPPAFSAWPRSAQGIVWSIHKRICVFFGIATGPFCALPRTMELQMLACGHHLLFALGVKIFQMTPCVILW